MALRPATGGVSNVDKNVKALAAYDALGELLATCTANAVAAGCTAANIATSNLSWQYKYAADGHQVRATPPV